MRQVTVREIRRLLPDIEAALRSARRGRPMARLVAVETWYPRRPSNADLHALMPTRQITSEQLVREDARLARMIAYLDTSASAK